MGQSCSWIGIRGLARADILERLELEDTGRADDGYSADLALGELASGWTILRSSDFDFPKPKLLAKLSQGAEAVSGQIEEHVMVSLARGFHDGRQLWSVIHDSAKGLYSLVVEGEPPAEFSPLSKRLREKQDAAGGEEANVDMIFDVAPDLVAKICGYRPDRDPVPAFREVELKSRSFVEILAWMFGRR